jgi:hypothetical protein
VLRYKGVLNANGQDQRHINSKGHDTRSQTALVSFVAVIN